MTKSLQTFNALRNALQCQNIGKTAQKNIFCPLIINKTFIHNSSGLKDKTGEGYTSTTPNPNDPTYTARQKRLIRETTNKPVLEGWEKRFGGGANLPDFIENWSVKTFYQVGTGLTFMSGGLFMVGSPASSILLGALTVGYWYTGLKDISQEGQAIRRNFPVLGNVRYFFESVRPEIRQYFIESDLEAAPFNRMQRGIAYKRAKGAPDSMPMGTRINVYEEGYFWINHSMYPKHVTEDDCRTLVGGPDCKQPYSASILNISGMSYGSLSDNAVLALNNAAKLGGFYHNTGEGGISRFHLQPGGDIVWNVGTGYFGCRDENGNFDREKFRENATKENVKMIEIKLSQGAKPAHGGILPKAKVTPLIAEARGVKVGEACLSPPFHSAFDGPGGLVDFIKVLRDESGGKPIGFKMCVGRPEEVAQVIAACVDKKIYPDFITVDGSEGGTGAAPPEFSNNVGMPLNEGLTLVHNFLKGAGIRDKVKIIASGKIITGFSLVRTLCLGADIGNAARGMMFALGCIQALKCHTNTCPTGITTQDKSLMKGLVVDDKSVRVWRYQKKTVQAAGEIIGAAGIKDPSKLRSDMICVRDSTYHSKTMAELYDAYQCKTGQLLEGTAPQQIQTIWAKGVRGYNSEKGKCNV